MSSHRYLFISGANTLAGSIVSSAMGAEDELNTVRDTAEAVRVIDSKPPDAVLWAVDSNDEESVVGCRTLRRHSRAPIVLLINAEAREQALRGYRLGADAHISIPCDRREFRARVMAVLRRI